jgi:hypothetical protein
MLFCLAIGSGRIAASRSDQVTIARSSWNGPAVRAMLGWAVCHVDASPASPVSCEADHLNYCRRQGIVPSWSCAACREGEAARALLPSSLDHMREASDRHDNGRFRPAFDRHLPVKLVRRQVDGIIQPSIVEMQPGRPIGRLERSRAAFAAKNVAINYETKSFGRSAPRKVPAAT